MSRIRPESNFRAFQNLVSEHSIASVPASLYNLTKSVPDPLICKIAEYCFKQVEWYLLITFYTYLPQSEAAAEVEAKQQKELKLAGLDLDQYKIKGSEEDWKSELSARGKAGVISIKGSVCIHVICDMQYVLVNFDGKSCLLIKLKGFDSWKKKCSRQTSPSHTVSMGGVDLKNLKGYKFSLQGRIQVLEWGGAEMGFGGVSAHVM